MYRPRTPLDSVVLQHMLKLANSSTAVQRRMPERAPHRLRNPYMYQVACINLPITTLRKMYRPRAPLILDGLLQQHEVVPQLEISMFVGGVMLSKVVVRGLHLAWIDHAIRVLWTCPLATMHFHINGCNIFAPTCIDRELRLRPSIRVGR